MKNKILDNLEYFFCACLGLLNFILLAFNYVAVKADAGIYGSVREGVNGYKIMQLFDANFGGVMSALMQVFILVVGILMLIWGVCGILKAFGVFNSFPDKLGKASCKKIAEIALYVFASLIILLLIFLIVYVASNRESFEELSILLGYEMKLVLASGVFISLVISTGSVVLYRVIKKKAVAE